MLFLVDLSGSVPVALRRSSSEATVALRNIRKRSPSLSDRPGCLPGATAPPNRVNTTQRLQDLRQQLIAFNVSAYIIFK